MMRVVVIGISAGGKSTLSQQLSEARGLPYFSIDALMLPCGWSPAGVARFAALHDEILARDAWVIDGIGPWETIRPRLSRADTIVLVDNPLWLHFAWATKRGLARLVSRRTAADHDTPHGIIHVYRTIWRLHRTLRPWLGEAVEVCRPDRRVFRLTSARDLAEFRARHCRPATEVELAR